jgi:hypothetical protein
MAEYPELEALKTQISKWKFYDEDVTMANPWILWNTQLQETSDILNKLINIIETQVVTIQDLDEMVPVGSLIFTNKNRHEFNPNGMKIYPGVWQKISKDIYIATAEGEDNEAGGILGENKTKITIGQLPSTPIDQAFDTEVNPEVSGGKPFRWGNEDGVMRGIVNPNAIHDRNNETPSFDAVYSYDNKMGKGIFYFPDGNSPSGDGKSVSSLGSRNSKLKDMTGGHERYAIDARHKHHWNQNITLGKGEDFDKQPKRIYKVVWERVS